MKTFEEVKKYIVDFATEKGACNSELSRVKKANSVDDLLEVVRDNLEWVRGNGLFSGVTITEFFRDEDLIKHSLYNSGKDNSGFGNTGYRNTGYRNTGYWNTGDRNTGYWNTGDRNTGDRNTGDRNTGDRNTGYSNTGYSNTGDRNTGDWNTGYSNTGDWNTGDWNTGYSNTGDWNTGVFCTGNQFLDFFNKPSKWTQRDFLNSRAYGVMRRLETKIWIYSENMTREEKEKNPSHETAGGYLRDIPIRDAWANLWGNLVDRDKLAFSELPNFDPEIFEKITGINFRP